MMEILQKIHQIMDANVKSVDEYNLLCEMHNRLRLVTTHRQHADAMSTRATSIGDWGYVSGLYATVKDYETSMEKYWEENK